MPLPDERYIAYQLLRELDAITSSIMSQVAYGRFRDESWQAAQVAHREAFERWMQHAATLDPASAVVGAPLDLSPPGDPVDLSNLSKPDVDQHS